MNRSNQNGSKLYGVTSEKKINTVARKYKKEPFEMSGTDEFAVDMSLTNKVAPSSDESSVGIPEELTDKNDFQY